MQPVLFHLPLGIPIHAYGVMLGLSLVVGWYLTLGLCARDGLDRALMARGYLVTAALALVGARLLFVATNPSRFPSALDVVRLDQGGLVAYGGFIGGFIGAALFCRARQVRLLAFADCAVPSLATGLLITRVGCFLYGCDFGRPWDGPLAVRFPAGSPAFKQQRMEGLLGPEATRSLAVHPTQLYEALVGLVLLVVVLGVRRRRRTGEAFAAFTMGYAVLRFPLETLRADAQRGALGSLSTSQVIALVTFALGAGLWGALPRGPGAAGAAAPVWRSRKGRRARG